MQWTGGPLEKPPLRVIVTRGLLAVARLSYNALGNDLKKEINQGLGIELSLLDHPCNSTMLLKWSELRHVQIFVQYFRRSGRVE